MLSHLYGSRETAKASDVSSSSVRAAAEYFKMTGERPSVVTFGDFLSSPRTFVHHLGQSLFDTSLGTSSVLSVSWSIMPSWARSRPITILSGSDLIMSESFSG